MKLQAFLLTAIAPMALSAAVHAQTTPAATGSDTPAAMQLPAACTAGDPSASAGMGEMDTSAMNNMEGHRGRMMQGIMETHDPMMQGLMNDNPDLAFACGMIAHHQAAIRMSEAQGEFGLDETMRGLAERIIEAQQSEIEELTNWVESQAVGATDGAAGESTAESSTGTAGAAPGATGSSPSAPIEGSGAGKSTATGGVPMEPNATADSGDATSDPSTPGEGEGAGKSTATGGVPMEPNANADSEGTTSDGQTTPPSN